MTHNPERQGPEMNRHEEYSELCALATSGSLSDHEWSRLQDHLAQCGNCREELHRYREIARTGMALLMPDGPENQPEPGWSPELAKKELFARLQSGEYAHKHPLRSTVTARQAGLKWWQRRPWYQEIRYAAAAILIGLISLASYVTAHRAAPVEIVMPLPPPSVALRAEVERLKQQQDVLEQDFESRSAEVKRLSTELERRTGEISTLRRQQTESSRQASQQISTLQGQYAAAVEARDALAKRVQEAQGALQLVQARYDALRESRSAEATHTAALQKHIDELTARLAESEISHQQAKQFLAQDRDVRELMGARDLYIADVYDVDGAGNKEKPFGRVFYTKGKSLIFYAFDLDQKPALRDASIFQAWGRRGFTDKRPLNMGIFYLDNEANKRWVLKFDDPKALAQVDAIFVTVEPPGGSQKPSGQQLLFASLRSKPNHP